MNKNVNKLNLVFLTHYNSIKPLIIQNLDKLKQIAIYFLKKKENKII